MFSLIAVTLFILVIIVGFWQSHLRARELAIAHAKALCKQHDVQWLDQSVALSHMRLHRNTQGWPSAYRTFVFDYANATGERRHGQISVFSGEVTECSLFAKGDESAITKTDRFNDAPEDKSKQQKSNTNNIIDIQEWVKNKKSQNDEDG